MITKANLRTIASCVAIGRHPNMPEYTSIRSLMVALAMINQRFKPDKFMEAVDAASARQADVLPELARNVIEQAVAEQVTLAHDETPF